MKRIYVILLILLAFQLFTAPVFAETIKLTPRKHREKFLHHRTQEVLKDAEWTTTAVIEVKGEDIEVRIEQSIVKYLDKPAGISSDKTFKELTNSVAGVEALLGNGQYVKLRSVSRLYTKNQQVLMIISRHSGYTRGEKWSHQWWVRKPTQPLEQAVSQASSEVNVAAERPRVAQLELMGRIVGLLAPHGEADHDIAIGASLIDLERDRQELLDDKLEDYLDKIRSAVDETERSKAWRQLRQEMLERSAYFMRTIASSKINKADAQRLLNIVKYGAQAVDDLKDLSPQGGATSEYTRFLTYAHGIAALAEGVENKDARLIMGSLRDTVGTMKRTISPLGVSVPSLAASIIDIPGEVVAGMLDVSREGLDEVTDTMEHINADLDGDKEALGHAVESSRRIEKILSSENYGRAMEDAITDRIIDKIPFLRTIVAWFK